MRECAELFLDDDWFRSDADVERFLRSFAPELSPWETNPGFEFGRTSHTMAAEMPRDDV